MIAESGAGDASEARAFFATEYRLNHLMFEYPKPITAIVDGIVMGGGVGIDDVEESPWAVRQLLGVEDAVGLQIAQDARIPGLAR